MTVANPIYDIIFKYLLEDERIAKTILSALLKTEVLDVKVRKNEYANTTRDSLSIFRIDFGATILDKDGKKRLILIELQKTWLETETLRFRQYLGAHYANPENILPESKEGYAIPMVTVYLLGHNVGDIETPVFYVNRNIYDYDGNEVKKGVPHPFVDSLTHDSIIVQIPRLRGQVNNRVEHVLSIFDQSRMDSRNRQILNIDEDMYAGEEDMLRIIHRLLSAASDSKLRHDMNVEDEYFSAIEDRDTAILLRDKQIAEQGAQIREQGVQIAEQDAQLREQGVQIAEQDAQLREQGVQIAEQDAQLREQGAQIAEQDAQLREQGAQIAEQGAQIAEQGAQIREQSEKLAEKDSQLAERDEMLCASVRMLLNAGLSKEAIAVNFNKTIEEIDRLLSL